MALINAAAFDRDANRIPITQYGFFNVASKSLTASNTTAAVPLFTVQGVCEIRALYGVVTTALSSNITTAFWRLNDQTTTVAISLATGTTLSSFGVGAFVTRRSLVSVALVGSAATNGSVTDPVAATAPDVFMPFLAIQKTGGVQTDVEFVYTTTNTPASGAIDFYIGWVPLTPTSQIISY